MNIFSDVCRRIQCGAVSQAEAGFAALLACSQSGEVGVLGCGHPDCSPYTEEMRARGVCPPAAPGAVAVVPPSPAAPPAALLTPPLPSITPVRPQPVPVAGVGITSVGGPDNFVWAGPGESWYCPVNRWVNENIWLALGVVAGIYLVARGRK
jgi:hypothetical protein